MKSSLFSPQIWFRKIIQTAKRFPLENILVWVLFFLCIIQVNDTSTFSDSIFAKLFFSLLSTIFLSLGVSLYREYQWKVWLRWIHSIGVVFFGIGYYYFSSFQDLWMGDFLIPAFVILFFFVSFLFSLPYISSQFPKNIDIKEYSNFFLTIVTSFATSTFIGWFLFLLSLGAFFSVNYLFDLSFDIGKVVANIFITSATLIAPLFFLSSLPFRVNLEKRSFHMTVFGEFLIKYIMIPFMYIYLIILYAYTLRVLINFHEWPKGMMSWLVIVFSFFGYVSYILSLPYVDKSVLVRVYRKIFPLLLLPQILMLFYAIWLRIGQYDLTINRYFVVLFGLWLLFSTLYFLFSRGKKIIMLPFFLSLLTLFISFGPFSVIHLPLQRQEARLMEHFEEAGMVQSEQIVPLQNPKNISPELITNMRSEIEYVCQYNQCRFLKERFGAVIDVATEKSQKEYWEMSGNTSVFYPYQISQAVIDHLQIPESNSPHSYESPFISIAVKNGTSPYGNFPISIAWYDISTFIQGEYFIKNDISTQGKPFVIFDSRKGQVLLYEASGSIVSYPFSFSGIDFQNPQKIFTQKDLTFHISDDVRDVELIFQDMMIKNPSFSGVLNDWEMGWANGIALIKYKK